MAKKTNCVKNGIAYYRLTKTIGHDASGKPVKKEFYGSSKTDAENKRDRYLDDKKIGLNGEAIFTRTGNLFHTYMYEVLISSDIEDSTYERYESVYRNHIKDYSIMDLMLSEVDSLVIQRFYNDLYHKEGYTKGQIESINKVFNGFFEYCIITKYIKENPLKGVNIPGGKKRKKEIEIWSDDQVKKIVAAAKEDKFGLFYLMALGCGMRRGELLALRHERVKGDTIIIRRSLRGITIIKPDGTRQRKLVIGKTKSPKSDRDVTMPPEILRAYQIHKAKQLEDYMAMGLGRPKYVFTTKTGNLIDPANMYRAYSRFLKRIGLPHKKFHIFRHTFGSTLARKKVPINLIQEIMGHENIETTMVYLHTQPEDKKEAAEVANSMFL